MTVIPQHMEALGRANEYRFARAALHREVRALAGVEGRARVADLIEYTPPCIDSMHVTVLLCWIHRVRETQARRLLRGIRSATGDCPVTISETRLVRDLTGRERAAIARYLRGERVIESRWAS